MKRLLLLLVLAGIASLTRAQLVNTQWQAKINVGQTINVVFNFAQDTCNIYNMGDSSVIEKMVYKIKDSVLSLQKIEGQSDCETTSIATYKFFKKEGALYFILLSDDCEDRSSTLDNTKWLPWVIPAEAKLDEAALKQYVGTYQLNDAHPILITFENGRLQIEAPNNGLPKLPLIAVTPTKFFLKAVGVYFDFVIDANGNVVTMISHEEKDYELKKVK